jgi:signal transduction histidine kinase
MLRQNTPRLIFISALVLLLISGIVTGWTIYRLYQSEQWVHHTFEVELTLGSIESDLSAAGRSRTMFFNSGDPKFLQDFANARASAMGHLVQLRAMISDNPDQVERCSRLEAAVNGRMGAVEKAIELAKADRSDKLAQEDLTANVADWAQQTSSISDEMNRAEEILLQRRTKISDRLFILILSALLFTFLLAIVLMWEHYRRLGRELEQRTLAEQKAENLSVQILRTQDEERRRVSRELHDGLGQNLSAAKMIADSMAQNAPDDPMMADLAAILDDSLSSVRNLSYLLHPPLLDEMGLAFAAESFVDGFARRTGIAASLKTTGDKRRLPAAIEITLFRILQESMSNIQRHARTSDAEVALHFYDDRVSLRVEDHGAGMSAEKLAQIEKHGNHSGLGLTGMRQRTKEQGGTFQLSSSLHGTSIVVELPDTPKDA